MWLAVLPIADSVLLQLVAFFHAFFCQVKCLFHPWWSVHREFVESFVCEAAIPHLLIEGVR